MIKTSQQCEKCLNYAVIKWVKDEVKYFEFKSNFNSFYDHRSNLYKPFLVEIEHFECTSCGHIF